MTAVPPTVPGAAVGPPPVPGRPEMLGEALVRLTPPNPGLMTGPGTNTYLVGGAELAVVDPGPDDPGHRRALLAAAAERGGVVRWVVVTHTHPDHAPGAAALAAATGAEVIGFEPRDGFSPDRLAGDGFLLAGPGFGLRAVHTPGHAADHLCWLLEEERILFSGDHVMEGSTVVIRPPDGEMAAYLESLERVGAADPQLSAIAPGHGRLIGDPVAVVRAVVAHRLARERAVAAALAGAGRATVDELLPTVYADVGEALRPVARYSLWAHLRKLAQEGRAASTVEPDRLGEDEAGELEGPWEATAATAL